MGAVPGPVSRIRLTWAFLRIGALAFGGLGATIALIERELVQRHGVASKTDVTEALTYTKLLPGSTGVQVVAYLGWRLHGWPGSALATAAFLLPSIAAMLVLARGYAYVATVPAIASVRHGVLAAVVALLLQTLYRLARPVLTGPLGIGLALGAFALVVAFHAPVVWVVVAAGVIGMIRMRR